MPYQHPWVRTTQGWSISWRYRTRNRWWKQECSHRELQATQMQSDPHTEKLLLYALMYVHVAQS